MHKTVPVDDYILDTLLRDLTGHDRKPAAFLVYLWLTGAQSAVRWLVRRKLLTATKANATAVPVYTVQFPWRRRA